MAKINSVKIDKNQILKDTFKKKGLPEILSEVSFNTDITDTTTNLLKKFISAVKSKFKKDFFNNERSKQMNYFDKINIHGIYQVKFEEFGKNENPEFVAYIEKLIKQCSTLKKTSKKPDVVKVTIKNGEEEYQGYSLLNGEITGKDYHRSSRTFTNDRTFGKEYYYLLDIPSLIAETIMIQSLVKFAEDNKELIQYIITRAGLYHTVPVPVSDEFRKEFINLAYKYGLNYQIHRKVAGIETYSLFRTMRYSRTPISDEFKQEFQLIADKYGLHVEFTNNSNKEEFNFIYVIKRKRQPFMPVSSEFRNDFLEVAKKHNLDYKEAEPSEAIETNKAIFYGEKVAKVGTKNMILHVHLLHIVIEEFIKQSNFAQSKAKEEYDNRSDYARSFQTKKAIKQSHLKRMEKNAFLLRYGYVELDNEVEVESKKGPDKFTIVEENFKQLIEFFPIPMRKDYSFRIKKLGHHKAAGIFYPHAKATIFDLNHPSSYVHEALHQIDFILGENTVEDFFSETMEFRSIYDLYKELVTNKINSLPKDNTFRILWEGKTKYNKNYFLKPTEVFARSGEIYIANKELEPNSLFKEANELKEEPVYPFDEAFIEAITKFFDELLIKVSELTPSKDEKKTKASKPVAQKNGSIKRVKKEDFTFVNSEQLSLFND